MARFDTSPSFASPANTVALPLRLRGNQTVTTVASANAASAAVNAATVAVTVYCGTAVNIALGAAATASSFLLPANTLMTFGVNPGDTVNVYSGTAGLVLHIAELAKVE